MIKKIMLCFIILALNPCYSADSEGVTVLDHKSWISGSNESGAAISGHLEKNPPVDEKQPKSSANTTASTSNVSGVVYQNVYTSGNHSYSVDNTSSQPQVYTINLSLCANSSYCFNDQSHIKVNKGGHLYDSATSRLTCSFNSPGNYSLEAKTEVSGDTSSSARGSAIISIRK